jgi:hypothetical protein
MGSFCGFLDTLPHWFLRRLKNQEKQIDLQINQRVDGRFNSAISLLGSSETSARTGTIYALSQGRRATNLP